jgi:ubiquinone biosynthesis UbiH/UbiF/VisC/COQ6 family hydroxylase
MARPTVRDAVCVVGHGPIGSSVALLAARAGLDVQHVSAPRSATASPARALALSPGSMRLLHDLGVGSRLAPQAATAFTGMEVSADDGRGTITFDAADAGESVLGHIVDGDALDRAFDAAVAGESRIATTVGVPERLAIDAATASLVLAGGRIVTAPLLVAADGAQSWVRRQVGFGARRRDYAEDAITARLACEQPHRGIARQWFVRDGVIALLPQHGDHVALVWSAPERLANELADDPDALAVRLMAATGGVLGALRVAGPVGRFPLHAHVATRWTAPRVALVGDAAHQFHPLAGQGANVGFRDARALGAVLAQRAAGADPGDARALAAYARARQEDAWLTFGVTDALQRLFSLQLPWLRPVRSLGLSAAGRLAPLRAALARHAVQ